jgi:hypothetical protein
MIDVDFQNPQDQVRLNIGDPNQEFVSDNTVNSALVAFNNNVFNASVAIMEAMLTQFSTLADREREGQVEVYYTKLYERYAQRLKDFKDGGNSASPSTRAFLPIIIGGVSRSQKEAIRNDVDAFSMYDLAHWHSESLGYKSVYEVYMEDIGGLPNNG